MRLCDCKNNVKKLNYLSVLIKFLLKKSWSIYVMLIEKEFHKDFREMLIVLFL